MSEDLYNKMKQTALAHAHAYSESPPWNPDKVAAYRTPDCIQSLHPKESIPAPFNEDLSMEQFHQALYFFRNVLSRSSFEISNVVVDAIERKVAMDFKGDFDLKAVGEDPAEYGFTATYVWILKMTETGDKVARVDEFMDVQRLMDQVRPRAEKYAKLHGDS